MLTITSSQVRRLTEDSFNVQHLPKVREAGDSVSEWMTFQIANTRFAIRSNHPPFVRWLAEINRGFRAQQEPHLRLNVSLTNLTQAWEPAMFLTVKVEGNYKEHDELRLSAAYAHHTEPFWPMLQICLRCAIAAKQPPDLILHSSGVVHEGKAFLFSGKSGAGKSTASRLLAEDTSFTVLHDDMVAIARTKEGFHAWSTPLSGEMPASYSMGAPLQAVFFLKHDQTNFANRLSRRKAAALLAFSLVPPLIVKNGSLVNQPAESVKQLFLLADCIPCYELHFRPERGFWECISQLFEDKSALMVRKGEVYG